MRDIVELRGADEGPHHQIVDTFATIDDSDHAWTEQVCVSVARKDGSLKVDFGLGKRSAPERTGVGPLDDEIVRSATELNGDRRSRSGACNFVTDRAIPRRKANLA